MTNDLADRVEALLGIRGVTARIREMEGRMEREMVALSISDDFIARRFGETSREEVLEHAIRTAMSILTEGVVAAPTEGIAKVDLGKNDSGTEYARIFYSGPIRSAGGTAQALSVLVADYVRRALNIDRYRPRQEEVERYIEEIRQYHARQHLQYVPSEKEIRLIVENCPVCIDGEGTEDEEVSGYRNLARVGTNSIRGGMALVIAEGLALKAPKLEKHVRNLKTRRVGVALGPHRAGRGAGRRRTGSPPGTSISGRSSRAGRSFPTPWRRAASGSATAGRGTPASPRPASPLPPCTSWGGSLPWGPR